MLPPCEIRKLTHSSNRLFWWRFRFVQLSVSTMMRAVDQKANATTVAECGFGTDIWTIRFDNITKILAVC